MPAFLAGLAGGSAGAAAFFAGAAGALAASFFAFSNLGLQSLPAGRSSVLAYTASLWVVPLSLLIGEKGTMVLPHVGGPHRGIGEEHVYEDIMQLVDWIRDGTSSVATAEHARHVIDIIESAYRAAETGQTQVLRTTF